MNFMLLGDPIAYWLLKIVLLLTLIVCGYGISKSDGGNNKFKINAIVAGVVYSLIQGLRWDRGQDYMHYWNDIHTYFSAPGCTPDPEPIYFAFVSLWKMTGIPAEFAFVVYSALFIGAFLLILKKFPQTALWALPLFYLITESSSENLIRQFFAICFVIFAYSAYLDNKKRKMYIMLCIASLIHFSSLIAIFLFLFLTHYRMPKIKVWWLVALYIGLYYFWDMSYFGGFADWLGSFNFSDSDIKMGQGYLENTDRWFTEEGSIANVLGKQVGTKSIIDTTVRFLVNVFVIYFGYKVTLTNPKLQLPFYFAYLSIIVTCISGDIELLTRIDKMVYFMVPFVIGLIMSNIKFDKPILTYAFLGVFIINFYFYGFIRQIGSIPYHGCAFIWDR